mgnify:CR=1 FL=1
MARTLFAEKGFEGASVEEIAHRANVSKPVVYEHFGGKEGAYLSLTTGLRSAAYSASARAVSCIITTVGTGTAGRSFFAVVYVLPTATAATKV